MRAADRATQIALRLRSSARKCPKHHFQTLNAKPIPYKVSFRESYWFEVRRFYKTASCHSVLKCPQLEGLIVGRWDPSTDSNTHNIPLNPKQETEASSSSQHRCQASSSQKPSHLVLDNTSGKLRSDPVDGVCAGRGSSRPFCQRGPLCGILFVQQLHYQEDFC